MIVTMIILAIIGGLFFLPYLGADNSDNKAIATIIAIPGSLIIIGDIIIFLCWYFW